MNYPPLAVQMYTVREAAAQDFAGTLEKVARLGYSGVELAGTYGMKNKHLARLLANLGLTCFSAHVPLADLKHNLPQVIDSYLALGVNYLVCPWLTPEERGNEADYRALAKTLNRIGAQCRAHKLQLCYHHHDFELVRFGQRCALDILLDNCEPVNLQLEADTYWLKFGGQTPATYIRQRAGRVPLLHLKDMTATEPVTFAEVGRGVLNWIEIFEAANAAGTQWFVVEQDECPGDPFESLRISRQNLETLLATPN